MPHSTSKGDWPNGERGFNSKLLQYIPSFVLEYVKSEQEIVFKVIKSLVQHEKDELLPCV